MRCAAAASGLASSAADRSAAVTVRYAEVVVDRRMDECRVQARQHERVDHAGVYALTTERSAELARAHHREVVGLRSAVGEKPRPGGAPALPMPGPRVIGVGSGVRCRRLRSAAVVEFETRRRTIPRAADDASGRLHVRART